MKKRMAKKYQNPPENILLNIGTLAKKATGLIDLSIGDPDLTTDERIIEQARVDALNGHTKYTAANGSQAFLEAVCQHYQTTYNNTVLPEEVRATVGAMHGMLLALLAIVDEGDEVIIHEPYFSPYKKQVEMAGGVPVFVPTFEKDDFVIDLTLLEQRITDKTKAIIINSPNNPTGAVFPVATFKGVAELAKKHDLFILSDEIYEALSFYEDFVPMRQFAPDHTITFSGFSKAYAMTGWRIGYMIAPAYINEACKHINENVTYSAPTLSQQAGIYALNNSHLFVPEIYKTFKARIDYVESRVKNIPFLSMKKTKGTMYAYINIEKTNLDSVAFVEHVLEKTNVLLVPGLAFGETTGQFHVRLAVTQNITVLKEAFDRILQLSF